MTICVLINEQHKLLPDQEHILNEAIDEYKIIKIPVDGWTSTEIVDKLNEIRKNFDMVIFVSPIPLMIALAVKNRISIGIMYNEKREINEKIISTVAQTKWELIFIN